MASRGRGRDKGQRVSSTPTPPPTVRPEPGARPAPARTALSAVCWRCWPSGVIAVNLRPGATWIGPVMEDMVGAFGQGAIASGLLTALPCIAFGVFGFLAVPISRRLGLTGTIVASFVLVAIGLLLRPAASSFGMFLVLSLLVLMGPALGNVVVPAWIKQHGELRTGGPDDAVQRDPRDRRLRGRRVRRPAGRRCGRRVARLAAVVGDRGRGPGGDLGVRAHPHRARLPARPRGAAICPDRCCARRRRSR